VEEAFLETARKIYEKIQNGRWANILPFFSIHVSSILLLSLDLNAAESGVQQKSVPIAEKAQQSQKEACNC